jgi:hypothetical protein
MCWILSILFALVMVPIIAGQSSAPSTTTRGKDCKQCKEDFAWYSSLSWWKKAAFSAWWVARKIACAADVNAAAKACCCKP